MFYNHEVVIQVKKKLLWKVFFKVNRELNQQTVNLSESNYLDIRNLIA